MGASIETLSIKVEIDSKELDEAVEKYALVSRADVQRMIAAAIKDCEGRLPATLRQARHDGRM